uniref:ATP-binding cassette transporter n=1 Tax=Diaphorina citri TaxID=121845 RepID=A0A6G5VBJ1_DIACI|nr:ATP-binding cassette transporter [Diaphorina citri]
MGVTGRKLKVVTWKCLVMRRRHWLLTLFEILIPACLFGLVLYGMSVVDTSSSVVPPKSERPISAAELLKDANMANGKVKYCPRSGEAKTLMDKFSAALKASHSGYKIDFDGYDTELEMMKSFKNVTDDEKDGTSYFTPLLGIVFNELSVKDSKLSYTLRTKEYIQTASLFPDSLQPGPGTSYRSYLNLFLPIQLLVDKVFAGMVSPTDWEVSIQPNPYPAYTKLGSYAQIFSITFPMVTAISFLFMFPLILTKVVQEKVSGVKELQQMMGLPSWMIWYGFLFNSLVTALLSMLVVIVMLLTGVGGIHLFKYSDPSVLFVLLLLYVTSCILYCFLVSSIFLRTTPSLIVGMVLWCILLIIVPIHVTSNTRDSIRLLATYFPGYAMICGFKLLGNFEANGVGMTWLKLFHSGGNANTYPMGVLFLNMLVSIFVMGILIWYVDNVRPGPYGLKKPYLFFLKKSYWMTTKSKSHQTATDHSNYTATFEPPPPNAKVGIRVRDLAKNFGNFVAVDNISIDFYEGQITALLGHNGAGKTTTMSILTGMFPPSAGEVTVQNYNIFKHMDQFRDSLGLCPQHNLLFPYLSVIQHLIFFGMIKGLTKEDSRKSGLDLLTLLNMVEKKNQPVSALSGGMKRKLQLAIALIGSPKVLMLDEPTSGMDPESRREMWDLLLSMRGERTIIITTHFMEEADVLGDRIAIMDHGKIKCYGTTLFLKKIYGAGYQLTFLTSDDIRVSAITDLIKSHVPDASLHNTQSSQITYTLPTQDTSPFPALFATLEEKKSALGISSIGIACTTIEEVFLKVGDLASKEKIESVDAKSKRSTLEQVPNGESNKEPLLHQKVQGIRLFMQRFWTLVTKRCIYFQRTWITGVLHGAVFLFALGLLTYFTRINIDPFENPRLTYTPTLYEDAIYYVQNNATQAANSLGAKIAKSYKAELPDTGSEQYLEYGPADNLTQKLLQLGTDNEQVYRTKVLAGASIGADNRSTLLFNSIPLHSAPISVNLHSTALLRALSGNPNAAITTTNHPINFDAVPICDGMPEAISVASIMSAAMWSLVLGLILPIWFAKFFSFPVVERVNNCKQLQLMTGTSWLTYWLALFSFDYGMILVTLLLGLGVVIVMDLLLTHLIAYPVELGVLFLVFLLFATAMLLFTYSYSLIVQGPESLGYYFVLNVVFGNMYPLVYPCVLRPLAIFIGDGIRLPISEETNLPIFIVQNLKKTFFYIKRKLVVLPKPGSFKAVRGVSFAVSPGECFGLLGVNGAGKTTTFRMLTGDTVCTDGTATLFGYSLSDKKKYLSGIGYCPQFNGINEHLTAQEMLECFSALRGIPGVKSGPIIDYWIDLLGLTEYRHRVSGRYSGGNKRKLSTAMALIGDPPLVFLDEPTSGVDPISRHRLWAVLSQIQKTGQSIVLTSHSMDECEALCNRLTIMVRGEMQCLGNITYLKQRYGQGFTLMIKLREGDLDQLKERIRTEFKGRVEIKDEHKGLIHYQILDTTFSWSVLFAKMEAVKTSMDIVEDYSLSDTTLEQVFIAFAKGRGQRHPDNTTITEL